jgi:hypothetical protein
MPHGFRLKTYFKFSNYQSKRMDLISPVLNLKKEYRAKKNEYSANTLKNPPKTNCLYDIFCVDSELNEEMISPHSIHLKPLHTNVNDCPPDRGFHHQKNRQQIPPL